MSTARVIVLGTLYRAPESRIAKSGKAYVTATPREDVAGETRWWRITGFSESVSHEMLTLHDGDPVAVSGSFTASIYEASTGPRLSLSVVVDKLLTATKPKAAAKPSRPAPFSQADVAKPLPFDDPTPESWNP
jgi:single-stranded DNA-binding protein